MSQLEYGYTECSCFFSFFVSIPGEYAIRNTGKSW